MLPSKNRIKKKKDFELIFKKSRSFKNKFLILKTTENNLPESRFGFIVSQKISKKAVLRNKVRRRLSESVKDNFQVIKGGRDFVFIALSGIEKEKFSGIFYVVDSLLKKAGAINIKR